MAAANMAAVFMDPHEAVAVVTKATVLAAGTVPELVAVQAAIMPAVATDLVAIATEKT